MQRQRRRKRSHTRGPIARWTTAGGPNEDRLASCVAGMAFAAAGGTKLRTLLAQRSLVEAMSGGRSQAARSSPISARDD